MPADEGRLNLKIDFDKVRGILKEKPRVDVSMAVAGRELNVLEIIRVKPIDPDGLASDNVNVLC